MEPITNEVLTTILMLGLLAFLVEKRFSGRWTIVANSVIVYLSIFPLIAVIPDYLQAWTMGGLIAGVLCALSYLRKEQLYPPISRLFYWLYSSKTVLGVYLAYTIGYPYLSLAFAIVIWIIALTKLKHAV